MLNSALSLLILGLVMLLYIFSLKYNSLLGTLVILESIMLTSIMYILYIMIPSSTPSLFILLLSFAACEAALSLSLLTNLIRLHGNDKLINLTM
uniref:NADH dehydrogenase subunit 4L n=1 Tax=Virpazaria ripkeni TaxID=2939667 RepID=UPI0020293823|nr:NADH dehydrogenase subunit 4L [Virpazaria ripkeni]UPV69724.1 NADH dehydrogenase subunit 4L [Virpazaria ripkeni]UPV69737.1 NADH dehydrogenase subunit 4L [Virpazaria ripkeni]